MRSCYFTLLRLSCDLRHCDHINSCTLKRSKVTSYSIQRGSASHCSSPHRKSHLHGQIQRWRKFTQPHPHLRAAPRQPAQRPASVNYSLLKSLTRKCPRAALALPQVREQNEGRWPTSFKHLTLATRLRTYRTHMPLHQKQSVVLPMAVRMLESKRPQIVRRPLLKKRG